MRPENERVLRKNGRDESRKHNKQPRRHQPKEFELAESAYSWPSWAGWGRLTEMEPGQQIVTQHHDCTNCT